MNRKLCGKGVWDNYVRISFDFHRHSIMYIFDTKEEALNFYKEFDFSGEKLSLFKYLKYKFCKHKNTYVIKGSSDRYHYKYCPDCNRSEYVDTETFEQRVERLDRINKRFKQDKINELRNEIESKQRKIGKLIKEYIEEFNEEF